MTLEELFTSFVETGDEVALERVFRRCSPTLRRHARRLGHRDEDAEDLVQETMVTAVHRADAFSHERRLLPWLKGILTLKAAHLARNEARRARVTSEFAAETTRDESTRTRPSGRPSAPERRSTLMELTEIVERVLPSLPDKYHGPLRMQLLDGKTPAEIARVTGVSRATIRVQLHRGIRLLRQRLPTGLTPGLLLLLLAPRASAKSTVHGWRRGPTATIAVGTAATVMLGWVIHAVLSTPGESARAPVALDPASPSVVEAAAAEPRRREVGTVDAAIALEPALLVLAVTSEGRPVPGVGVHATPIGRDPVLHTRRACTDANGCAEILGLEPGVLHVELDRGPTTRVVLTALSRPECVLTVPATPTVRGRVVDARQRPIAAASVWLSEDASGPWRGQVVTTTDAAGEFVLEHAPRGSFVAGFSPHHVRSDVLRIDGAEPIELRLGDGGGSVRGVVLDDLGSPVADAVVLVGEAMDGSPLHLADGAAGWRPPPIALRTASDGSFRSSRLESDWHPLFVRAPGFAPHVQTIDVEGEMDVIVRLEPGERIDGRVVDARGVPTVGARVAYRDDELGTHVDLMSAADGSFALEGVSSSAATLAVRARGFAPVAVDLRSNRESTFLEIRLEPRAFVHGRVVAQNSSEGLAGFSLRFGRAVPQRLDDGSSMVRSDAEGRFEVAPIPHAAPLWIRGPGECVWRQGRELASWNGDELRIDVPVGWSATGGLAGRLLTHDGAAAARCRLFVDRNDDLPPIEIGKTDGSGAFAIDGLAIGDYQLFAESTTSTAPSFEVGPVRIRSDETTHVTRSAPRTGRVAFELARRDETPVGDAVVTIVGGQPRRRYALQMAPRGTCVLEPGRYELWAMGSRFAWIEGHAFEVRAGGESTVAVEVTPAVRRQLALRGLPPRLSPDPAICRVVARTTREEVGRYTLSADQPLSLGGVFAVGHYDVEVHTLDAGQWHGSFSIEELAPRYRSVPIELALAR